MGVMGVADGGLGPRQPNAERGPLSVVSDARRVGVNIKKLPLISHKAAANELDLCKVPGAQTWGPHDGDWFRRLRNLCLVARQRKYWSGPSTTLAAQMATNDEGAYIRRRSSRTRG